MSDTHVNSLSKLQRVYVKDMSFEAPDSLKTFSQQWKPDMHLDINTKVNKVQDKVFEVILLLTVTVKNESEVAFLVEVHQAGVFVIEETDDARLKRILGCYCPDMLFPYARECVSSQVARAGFPQLVLAPMDFPALFDDALAQQQKASTEESAKH